ncbi:MAG: helix-turn-helix domain-containing protein [Candidatus Levybacteria bacterium]|nr:helix-turn-helix domain-containing protein [Candidatus Levybacteria bacterium]
MDISIIEVTYPLSFRERDAKILGEHLRHRHSVDLIGMKRVGISNFLRYFLYRPEIVTNYISTEQKHLFIPVDLNDLVEREIYPFWSLTLKRIVDIVNASHLPGVNKRKIESLFESSIQSQDLFLMIDSVRQALIEAMSQGVVVTLFFLRFDRMREVVTPQFFDNLQGLKDATHQKLAYVFTSFRSLDKLSPTAFPKASLSVFSHQLYVKPASSVDTQIIYQMYKKRYQLQPSADVEEELFRLVDGYVQYLQLALIVLNEKKTAIPLKNELFQALLSDERILLQSEELWESLGREEKDALLKVSRDESLPEDAKAKASYLWDTGFVKEREGKLELFSPLFTEFLGRKDDTDVQPGAAVHFSKKEHMLYTLLEQHVDQICERETIVETVWPEYRELGVSDWAIDRLVARVRVKLKQQKSPYEIVTIRTRGYKLASLNH